MIGLPMFASLSQRPAPPTVPRRPNEPMIGQWLPCGT
jgi:hypothetical protein